MTEKLVRDRVPEIIVANGETCPNFRVASISEMPKLIMNKLTEELTELGLALENGSINEVIDEIADISQVLKDGGIQNSTASTIIEGRRKEKEFDRGGFKNRIVMEFSKS